MTEQYKLWIEKAEKDIGAAKKSFDSEEYEWACFQVQQAVEKALKAVIIKKEEKLVKTHDLVFLAKNANLPENLKNYCKEISLTYAYARYPDAPKIEDIQDKVLDYIKQGKEIIEWAKKNL